MTNGDVNWIANFIWGIADDVLRDLFVRGKYRDVILPMTVLRRLDAVLEPTKPAVVDMKASLDKSRITNQDAALKRAAKQSFYNTSKFTLRDLRARASQQQLKADFEAYLDGFSPNVQEILDCFKFRNQIPDLVGGDRLGFLIEKYLDPRVNLSPDPVMNSDGTVKLPGLDNHAMGTVFEELVRRFNEENNEEAGEHWTPRDAVKLMAKLVFLPIADKIESGTYLLYDGACGTGGMLTVAEETLQQLGEERGKEITTHLYGQEINPETYAIAKADLLLKGEGEAADNIIGGSKYSTLSNDAFPSREFDFMLSNPPYGKSWKTDLELMGGKDGIKDPRFIVEHAGDPEFSLLTRSSDGQLLFLANMVSKMKRKTRLGSRIAEVHNGSSLFTGDAGQGESNVRRWIIENDWLEAIVALPLNMFYNTGIATYVWVISNRKPEHRRGRVQLIDATAWFKPLRKNLGKKNCELADADIDRICETFLAFKETPESKILPNAAFGYWKVTVERPLHLKGADVGRTYSPKEFKALKDGAERDGDAPPIIRKIHKKGAAADPLHGLFPATVDTKQVVVEYEPDPDLRDTEQVPLLEPGGIAAFVDREVLPYASDAWIDHSSTKIGYEISFNRYFYKPEPLRTSSAVREEILGLEKETEQLLGAIAKRHEHLRSAVLGKGGRDERLGRPGAEWLGPIPEHWELKPNRSLLRLRKQLVGANSKNFTLLSLTLRGLVPRDMDNPEGKWPADFATYQVVEPGDLVFCLFDIDETPRTVGLATQRGMITGAYSVYECLAPNLAPYLYLVYLLADEQKRLRPYYTGLRKVIQKATFASIQVPVPPRAELDEILHFVESETAQIDAMIARAERQLDLVNEYRRRLVADVVMGRVQPHSSALASKS
jgi:type I restriction enzyme M protein